MDYVQAIEISAAGMRAEKTRIEAAVLNLSNMNATSPPGTVAYRPVQAVVRSAPASFGDMVASQAPAGTPVAELVPQAGAITRQAYDPGHPHADAAGMVAYPAVDHTREMLTVTAALRAYEANVAALQ